MNKFFFDTSIINDDLKKLAICNWIKQKINNNQIKFEKIFTLSINGSSYEDFHKYCDNKGPTIMFAKINNGYRFGGFSGTSWTKEDNWVKDKDAFLFSLNNFSLALWLLT